MEKFNFVTRDGISRRLPPGFRFQPTDEELVFQYLKRKVLSLPFPASIIPEINVCNYDPWDLPGDGEEERYLFSKKCPNGNRVNRATASGYWKVISGSDGQIVSSSSINQIMGMKKTLVFYNGKAPNGSKTDWVMHEYRLVTVEATDCNFPQPNNSAQNSFNDQLDNWVLCHIFMRENNGTTDNEITHNAAMDEDGHRFYEFVTREENVLGYVSSPSSVTSEEDYEAESSSRNIF